MDIIRPEILATKRRRQWLWIGGTAVIAIVATLAVAKLEPAPPVVDRDTVWIGTVERGDLVRQVGGHGILVPDVLQLIQSETTARVDRVNVVPGQLVSAADVLLELSSSEVERAAIDAENMVLRVTAELTNLSMSFRETELDQRANLAAVEAEFVRASLQAEANRELASKGLISDIQLKASEAVAASLVTQREVEQERSEVRAEGNLVRLKAKQAELAQQEILSGMRRRQLEALKVRAGIDGIVQEVPIEIGQQVISGTMLAQVAQEGRLRVELKVAATRARDVRQNQLVSIDTRNGLVAGEVVRVDPAVREGTVKVEVRLSGSLPAGARPDMAVEGIIEVEQINNILHVGRPVNCRENATLALFRLDKEGSRAGRVQVELGRVSLDVVEIIGGLEAGDQIILSDTSRWNDYEKLRLR